MNRLQHAYGTARTLYSQSMKNGLDPDAIFSQVVNHLSSCYPDIEPLRIREIATLAMI